MAKIMVIHHAASIGGGSISFFDILDMLREKHEVIACCPNGSQEFLKYAENRNHKIIPLDIPIPTFNHYSGGPSMISKTFWKGIINLKYKKKIEEFIISHNPDIVIVNSSVMCVLGPIIKKCGAEAVCFVRETFVEGIFTIRTKIMLKILNSSFDGVVFISNYDKNYAHLKNPITEVIADCLDCNSYKIIERNEACNTLNVSNKTFNILYGGGISWIKGLDIILKGLKYLEKEDVCLIIAGSVIFNKYKFNIITIIKMILNPKEVLYVKCIENLLKDEKISSKIKFVGVQTNMSNCYSASNIVVFPSNVAHQSRAVFEAALYSCPIVISDFKQTSEYVINDVNGVTFKPKDDKDLACVIKKLYLDKFKIRDLGEKNKEMGLKYHNFNMEKLKMQNFINQIVSK